ncbi:hypothetical protein LIX87_03445 [Weissella viridescens]|uniref:hypothetical protein n=1 Tax=Weissella viridescens TaxID=1629 RepID=UPI001D05C7B2|nr:hypothetical protein [Weissella viridescens]MCB6839959.1 hypothetical protein [Weissella viridescens]MCB6846807.1 hypothetical protein [Weissella viridescens]
MSKVGNVLLIMGALIILVGGGCLVGMMYSNNQHQEAEISSLTKESSEKQVSADQEKAKAKSKSKKEASEAKVVAEQTSVAQSSEAQVVEHTQVQAVESNTVQPETQSTNPIDKKFEAMPERQRDLYKLDEIIAEGYTNEEIEASKHFNDYSTALMDRVRDNQVKMHSEYMQSVGDE